MGGHVLKTYLVVPDIHVPFHCPKFIKLVTKLIKELNPDGLIQLGDAVDAFQISTYSKDPNRRNLLVEDIDDYKLILNEWSRHMKSGSTIHLLEGNHEHRLSRYIAGNCRDLHGLVPDWETLIGVKLRNQVGPHRWHWHNYSKWDSCKIGDCVLLHGFYYNQHVAMTNLNKYKTSTICGHTHRVQFVTDGTHFAATLGHGSNEHETAHQPTPSGWTQSIGILTEHLGKTSLEILVVRDGRTVFRGKHI